MASKRKVTQDDLRKMMAEIKSKPEKPAAGGGAKKLKLSARELALIEEEKRQKALRDQEKIRLKQEKMARIVPNQGLQPKKSILKNSSGPSNFVVPSQYYSSQPDQTKQVSIKSEEPTKVQQISKDPPVKKVQSEPEPDNEPETLPEGFFDDPKLDAKARNVQYVDQSEEEWQKFQKEMADEEVAAQDILVEDRNEATADRQLEDIDEQIQAWKRVAVLEEKKEEVCKTKRKVAKEAKEQSDSDEDVDSDLELDQLTDWRKKS